GSCYAWLDPPDELLMLDLQQSFREGLPRLAPLFASSRAERATVRDRIAIGATICHLAFLAVGCARLPEPSFTISSQTQTLKPEFQKQITKILGERCGRPLAPKLLGGTGASAS